MDDQRSKAAERFGADFMREARSSTPLPASDAVANQAKANARPIPTFKTGGPVRKAAGGAMGVRKGMAKEPGRGPRLDNAF